MTWAPAMTTPVLRKKAPKVPALRMNAFSFGPCTARFLFGAVEKEMGGASLPGEAGYPPSPEEGHPNLLLNKRKLRITYV